MCGLSLEADFPKRPAQSGILTVADMFYSMGSYYYFFFSKKQAVGFNAEAYCNRMLTNFSEYVPVQIIYKAQLVYYIHT